MPGQGDPDDPKRGLKLQSAARMWPTPTKQDGENNAGPSQWERNTPPLNVAVKLWPTPTASTGGPEPEGKTGRKLATMVKMWPTPLTAQTTKAGHNAISGRWKTAMAKAAGERVTGCLNPEWVEWLMGYPIGHTDSKDSGTPSSRKSQKR